MTLSDLRSTRDLRLPLDELIQTHGLGRVALALMRAALRPGRGRPPPVSALSDHLLRDIGLEPGDRRRR
ncbi:DUF1127 domain-containing protein [Paracoccus aminovorans]|uniref:DUF1127 domain-containing protein n=1 Tax=Paracoccus aminovorans TaxID=34004 RepID=UPI0007848145|nr:DUF1127 domain-containing protein [Paracoccus aminovorans]